MRALNVIAEEIQADWKKPYFGAVPYLEAMQTLTSIDGNYYADSAVSVVLYFLANASTWRGETARRIKKELNALAKTARFTPRVSEQTRKANGGCSIPYDPPEVQ